MDSCPAEQPVGSQQKRDKRVRKPTHKAIVPNRYHYLPYVDDSETPEDIMRKFEIMEAMRNKKSNQTDSAADLESPLTTSPISTQEYELDEEDMAELFAQIGPMGGSCEPEDFSDNWELGRDDYDMEMYGAPRDTNSIHKPQYHTTQIIYLDTNKGKRMVDSIARKSAGCSCYEVVSSEKSPQRLELFSGNPFPYLIEYTKIPQQLPKTWAHKIIHSIPKNVDAQKTFFVDCIVDYDISKLNMEFNAIFINIPFGQSCEPLNRLRLGREVIPKGFLFVWGDNEDLPRVIDIFENKGFFYVENLTWYIKDKYNKPLMQSSESSLLCRCKRTLLIMRKGHRTYGGNVVFPFIDLRHQRNPDVIIAPTPTISFPDSHVNDELYTTMETLVPLKSAGGKDNADQYLELFADPSFQRPGWYQLCQIGH